MILFLALYPQLALQRSEASVKTAVEAAYHDSGHGLSLFAGQSGSFASTSNRVLVIK